MDACPRITARIVAADTVDLPIDACPHNIHMNTPTDACPNMNTLRQWMPVLTEHPHTQNILNAS